MLGQLNIYKPNKSTIQYRIQKIPLNEAPLKEISVVIAMALVEFGVLSVTWKYHSKFCPIFTMMAGFVSST